MLNDSGLVEVEKIRNAGTEHLDRKDMDIKPGPRSDSCVTPFMFYLITVDPTVDPLQPAEASQSNLELPTALILVNHWEDVEAVFGFLWSQSPPIPTDEVRGPAPSAWRERAISSFKHGHVYILMATIGIYWCSQNFKGVQRLIFFTLP